MLSDANTPGQKVQTVRVRPRGSVYRVNAVHVASSASCLVCLCLVVRSMVVLQNLWLTCVGEELDRLYPQLAAAAPHLIPVESPGMTELRAPLTESPVDLCCAHASARESTPQRDVRFQTQLQGPSGQTRI